MKRYCRPLLSCAVFGSICMGILAEAYGSDLSDFLHSVFDEQQQRRPSGAELNYHANLTRQQGPLENYIVLCGSDDYFVNQAQRNLETYVARLYQVFLGRNPRPDELRYWVIQFQQSRVDRREMVRRFCRASGVTQLPSSLPTQPAFPCLELRLKSLPSWSLKSNCSLAWCRARLGIQATVEE